MGYYFHKIHYMKITNELYCNVKVVPIYRKVKLYNT